MDDAILERLIFDDALGALSPDASALLAAHIQTLPGGSERLAGWRRLAETARAAMPAEPPLALPPLRIGKLSSNPWRIGRIGVSIAAVLIMGVGIGLLRPREANVSPHSAIAPLPIAAEMPISAGVQDFWSSKRLLASAMGQKRENSSPLRWTSPIRQPEMEN
jgi:anti-sigma factor RsiW